MTFDQFDKAKDIMYALDELDKLRVTVNDKDNFNIEISGDLTNFDSRALTDDGQKRLKDALKLFLEKETNILLNQLNDI